MQEDLTALRAQARQHPAVRALPDAYISRNDVAVALAWLLSCDTGQRPKPGHAPPGSQSICLLVCDLVANDPGGSFTGHLLAQGPALIPACVCSGHSLLCDEAPGWQPSQVLTLRCVHSVIAILHTAPASVQDDSIL